MAVYRLKLHRKVEKFILSLELNKQTEGKSAKIARLEGKQPVV